MVIHRVLVVQPLHPTAIAMLEARPDVRFTVVTDLSEQNLIAHVGDIDAITLRDGTLPASVVEAAPHLKVISRHGVGYDNVPLELCTARGIPVTLTVAANAVSVAEHTMLLMLAAARSVIELDTAVRDGDFAVRSRLRGVELRGRTLVLVGYGRIGREVAARAAAFGMRVCVVDPHLGAGPPHGVELIDDLARALARADVVSLHVPLTGETRGLIGEAQLAAMPDGAILVNASRGGVVDEAALLAAVRSGHLHGAALDTFAVEPLPVDSPLLAERRIVLSPHAAALTEQSMIEMGKATVENALAALDGTLDPSVVVNPAVLAPQKAV
ncbi:MAG TPA: hydroxyacid dehydrogenase [Ilumatobacter sp.]|jgi:D-3-phosphoglycerate dehydrogenase|nr:hydroxyacid dehydrogenase [Ilumatobacter sp.]